MEIRSLANTGFDIIYRGFERAFAEYEMQLNRVELQTMLQRRGFDPVLSFAAFEGEEIVAFTLNGIGEFNGITTAYDTGTGTLKEYRGQGLATQVFEYSIPYLRDANVKQYLLEVLQHNTKAVSVYRNLGFEVTREFNYFRQQNEKVRNEPDASASLCSVEKIVLPECSDISGFRDFYPSWQNSVESIRRSAGDFISLGVFTNDRLIGYSVFEPVSGDITQLAVDKEYRRQGVASLLLREMLRLNKNTGIKAINTDIRCDSITAFLQAKNIELKGRQFEMIRKI
ncbi:MAG: GNAT family N-acetyltransferase [Tannerellaceae bacterium]|nr:GNAT family N-acetyltransferase [Tannerellaceae bacterium]